MRIIGTNRKLFLAEPIVKACNEAYEADFDQAMAFVQKLKADAMASNNVEDILSKSESDTIHRMEFASISR